MGKLLTSPILVTTIYRNFSDQQDVHVHVHDQGHEQIAGSERKSKLKGQTSARRSPAG